MLAAAILASGMAFLDSTVVNVALPRIESDLGGGLATMQWVSDAYLLTLGSLVLVGGALGDLLGRKRVFIVGIAAFGATSLLCGLAPTAELLIAARAAQGVAAALMVPASLAILSSVFAPEDRAKAIGLWSGLSAVTTAIGPVVGGVMVDAHPSGWRAVFLLNIPLAVVAVWLTRRGVPDIPGTRTSAPLRTQVDVLGGTLAVLGLALLVASLIEVELLGWPTAIAGVLIGVAVLTAFVVVERRREQTGSPPPMMPPHLFGYRSFAVANVQTFVLYGALGAVLLLFTICLQLGLGWTALAAGAAGIPITLILALGSSRAGALIPKMGAKPLLTAGPLVMAAGIGLLALIRPGDTYWWPMLPGVVIFGIGLTLLVAPITSTALGDIPPEQSGAGSGTNNAVARIASLIAIAAVPALAGLDQAGANPEFFSAYSRATLVCALLCVAGAVVAAVGYAPSTGRVSAAVAATPKGDDAP